MTNRSQQCWFITGASAGFGREIATQILAAGGSVFVTARDPATLADLVALGGDRAPAHALDVTDPSQIAAAVKACEARFGGIDVLVNNAGYGFIDSIEDADEARVRYQFEVNFFGLANVIRAALPGMRARRHGWIINFSSMAGRMAMPGGGWYSASKYAVEGLSESLCAELAPLGIGVTVVEPGAFRTEFAGRSIVLGANTNPDYATTAGATISHVGSWHGAQRGDPVKAMAALITAIDSDAPPRQLLLGPDAYEYVGGALHAQLAEIEKWRDLTNGTDAA